MYNILTRKLTEVVTDKTWTLSNHLIIQQHIKLQFIYKNNKNWHKKKTNFCKANQSYNCDVKLKYNKNWHENK